MPQQSYSAAALQSYRATGQLSGRALTRYATPPAITLILRLGRPPGALPQGVRRYIAAHAIAQLPDGVLAQFALQLVQVLHFEQDAASLPKEQAAAVNGVAAAPASPELTPRSAAAMDEIKCVRLASGAGAQPFGLQLHWVAEGP